VAADPYPAVVLPHPAAWLPIQAGRLLEIMTADPDIFDAIFSTT
jgi:hypothetical protein